MQIFLKIYVLLILFSSFLNASSSIVENADDLCYEDSISSGLFCFDMGICSGGLGCKNTFPLRNIGGSTLSNIVLDYNETGMGGSFGDSCGVDPSGSCQTVNNVDLGPFGFLGQATEFNLTNSIAPGDNNNSIWTENFMSGSCFNAENLYATYIKDGVIHRGKVKSCSTSTPPDETIPSEDANATNALCGTFVKMFQTHEVCNSSTDGVISFNNAGQTLDGSKNIIIDNSSNTLNTCLVDTKPWVKNQYETCGEQGDCVQTGTNGKKLNINYNNPPQIANINTNPSSSTDNITLNSSPTTLNGLEYNNITTSWHTNITANFNITNSLKINSLKMTTGNTFNFNSTNAYSLEIGTLGIENNGAGNSIATDTNAKNIKIATFNLSANTTLTLQATQTIKMNSFTVGRGSTTTLKAQYVNINDFTSSNSGSGNSVINIYADYIDISHLTLNQTVTIKIHPYTPGRRVLFRVNNLDESSSSSILLSSGNYYINGKLTIPGTSDISAIRAIDENQLINLYINNNLTLGNNPGINAFGNKGNYDTSLPASNFLIFVNGSLTTGGGGTTINATIYLEGNATLGNPTYIKGALSASSKIDIGQGQFIYDQNISDSGWGACGGSYCPSHNLTEGFHLIDPDGGDEKNSFEIFCHQDSNSNWHELIALPINNNSNNFVFDNNTTFSNYYDTSANPRKNFQALEVDISNITYSGNLQNGSPKPHIPVVTTSGLEPYSINTAGHTYYVMGSTFSNINLIGTPFTIDWNNTTLNWCDTSKLRKALGQAVKYNTLLNDGHSICKIENMKLSLLNDYRFLKYNGKEVLQHSCKEMAMYVPNNIGVLNDSDIAGHFNILTSEPSYTGDNIPTTNGTRDNGKDIGASGRPITVYCKYQQDLHYVWTFLTALDGVVTTSKTDLVSHNDTCSRLGLYFFVPNSKDTFNRVRKYLKAHKNGDNGWEKYTGTIEEKIEALHPGNHYYLSKFRDVLIWPYGPLGVYYPTDGWQSGKNSWYGGSGDKRGWMSGSPMHNIKTMANYNDSMGKKGWISILGSQDLNKTDDWWIADIGAGEEIGNTNPSYNPHGTHPIQSNGYKYYEPNGNYKAYAWLNFLFDSEGWIYHLDDWDNNYPYYDYMCMSDTNYEKATRYKLIPGFFNAIERVKNLPPNFSNTKISTQVSNRNISLDIILYDVNSSNGEIDTTRLNDQNRSVGVFLSSINGKIATPVKFLGEYKDFKGYNGRIEIPDFKEIRAIKNAIIQFYYCKNPNKNWNECWNYNQNPNAPAITPLEGQGSEHSDSYDNFAIRPKNFSFILQGTNHKAGVNYSISIKALDENNNTTLDYNESVGSSFNMDINETKSGCITGSFTPSIKNNWAFANGEKNLTVRYNEVGTIEIKIKEVNGSEFAKVDANDTNDTQRFIMPFDKNISFKPDHFNISASFRNYNNIFTCISNDLNMSSILDINITAKSGQNTTTFNYNKSCYAKKTDYNISYLPLFVNGLHNLKYYEEDSSIIGSAQLGNFLMLNNIAKNIFSTDHNGTAQLKLKINFDRNRSKAINPFKFIVKDINVSDNNGTLGTKSLNESSTFYYARVHSPDYSIKGDTINAKIYREIYCKDCNKTVFTSVGDESLDSIYWYINKDENSINDGKIYNFITSAKIDHITPSTVVDQGVENDTVKYNAGMYPYKERIEINASSWLIFNPYDQNASTNGFEVEFFGGSGWAGIGSTGKTVDLNISSKNPKRIEW